MSIRIHKLPEELGLDNKEMMSLLKERKIIAADVKSVSSTVDNINASVLREEFGKKKGASASATATVAPEKSAPPAVSSVETASAAPKVVLPSNVFVKSKQEVDREKEAAAVAKAAANKPAASAVPSVRPDRKSVV